MLSLLMWQQVSSAHVRLSKTEFAGIEIDSKDYKRSYKFASEDLIEERVVYGSDFKEMTFVLQILRLFNIQSGT